MSNTFPTSLNDWETNDTIESGWADSLENKIGVDNSAVTTSLDYILKNPSSVSPGHKHSSADITDTISVKAYGAVGDCTAIDQKGTGTWGISTGSNAFTATNAGTTFGKGYKNAAFTQAATDNTTAFKNAWDALLTAGVISLRYQGASTIGNNAGRPELFIPAGFYYISDAAQLFSTNRVSPSGTEMGFRIRGAGIGQTVLYVRIPGSTSTDYMFYDSDNFKNMEIEGLTIICTTGTERIVYQNSTTGQTGRWLWKNVEIVDYKIAFTFDGSTNADRWVWTTCQFKTKIAQATTVLNASNSQVVGHTMIDPNITHYAGGNIFDISAGGCIRITDGCGEIYGVDTDGAAGKLVYIHHSVGGMGSQNDPALIFDNFRMEFHDDSGIIDTDANTTEFRDCALLNISNTRWASGLKQHVVARHLSTIRFDGGVFGDFYLAGSTSTTDDYPYSSKAHVIMNDVKVSLDTFASLRWEVYTDATDGLTTVFNTTGTGGSAVARLMVNGCEPYSTSTYSQSPPLYNAVNGAPHAFRAWFGRPAPLQRVVAKVSSATDFGLPGEDKTLTITIPKNCELIRCGIVKQGRQSGIGGDTRTWRLTDGNGTDYAVLTCLGTDFWKSNVSADIYKIMAVANDRTFTLTCDAAVPDSTGTGAEGYCFVEYR